MKVSLNWIKEYTDISLTVDELVEKIGAQLGAVENVIDIGKKYQGIVVAKVVSCQKHPNADKLQLCAIDDGGITLDVKRDDNGFVQVVCGAPEVATGMTVAWIPPGSLVPSTYDKDPMTLEAREIRGELSQGMLGTSHELAISDDHSGLLIVESGIKPGTPLAEVYDLDDAVIDIENKMFTHRPDLFGILGVAREIAGIQNKVFKSPDWYLNFEVPSPKIELLPLKITNEVPELAPRVMAVAISNITIKPSPLWLQAALMRVGIRSINNIVDITNYVMHLTAQPMHAFDYHKIKDLSGEIPTLGPRLAYEGEELTLLGNKRLHLTKNDIVLATDKQAIDLAGVMGGADTEVDEHTTAIILTVCSFDMYAIRRATMRHGVFTDAATRYTKNQSSLQNDRVLIKALGLINEHAGSQQASEVFDVTNRVSTLHTVDVTADFINNRLGIALDIKEIAQLLRNVEFEIVSHDSNLAITAPFWRTDIEIPEDIVEEVGRLYGYDHLPLELPVRDLTPAVPDALIALKSKVRETLATAGANELLTYSFIHGNLIDKVGQARAKAFELSNAISPELQYYRLSLTPSLLDKVHANMKAGFEEFAIFEIGKVHLKGETDISEPSVPKEVNALSLVFAADDKISQLKYSGAPFYQTRKYLMSLFGHFPGIMSDFIRFEPLSGADLYGNPWLEQMVAPYEPSRSAVLRDNSGLVWGVVGEFNESVRRALKLPSLVAGFELDPLIFVHAKPFANYIPMSRFPSVSQDISLKVPAELPFADLLTYIKQNLAAPDNTHHKLDTIDIYQRNEDNEHKQITLRLMIASYQKTLTDREVNKLLDDVAAKCHNQFGAERL